MDNNDPNKDKISGYELHYYDEGLPFRGEDDKELFDGLNVLTRYVFHNFSEKIFYTPNGIEYVIEKVGKYNQTSGEVETKPDRFLIIQEQSTKTPQESTCYSISEYDRNTGLKLGFASVLVGQEDNDFAVYVDNPKLDSPKSADKGNFDVKDLGLTLKATFELIKKTNTI